MTKGIKRLRCRREAHNAIDYNTMKHKSHQPIDPRATAHPADIKPAQGGVNQRSLFFRAVLSLFCFCFYMISSILGHSSWCGCSDWSRVRPDWINCLVPLVGSTSLRDFISDLESKSLIHCHLEFLKWSLVELISTYTHTCTPVHPFNYQKHRLDRLLFLHSCFQRISESTHETDLSTKDTF